MVHLHGSIAAELEQEEGTHTQLLRAAMSRGRRVSTTSNKPGSTISGLGNLDSGNC